MPSLIGIDSGLTVTKAVIFDVDGRVLSVARRRIPQVMPKPHFVERDMSALWAATADAIREAIEASGRPASDIAAVAATAHGDGIFLLDKMRNPLGNGILSLDSRAGDIALAWNRDGTSAHALALTGQMPLAPAPSALLAWIKQNEPERFAKIGHILACKDWLRYCLAGTIGTDRTEASTSFTNVKTQTYSDEALHLFGLSALAHALPEICHSSSQVGAITPMAAHLTGLVEGTPVIAGLHDVTASALGIGAHKEGVVAVVAGTYSINEAVSPEPRTSEGWLCRNAIEPGYWNNMAISPASSTNYEWFLDHFCQSEMNDKANAHTIHERLGAEIKEALTKPSSVLFHPYLFGSPFGPQANAAFLGLRGWHDRGMVLRSIFEGIVFNHRLHIDALKTAFQFDRVMLTGGISRNPTFPQLLADSLNMPVIVSETPEAAAWGAALCAGTATGYYQSPQHEPRDLSTINHPFLPQPDAVARLERRYNLFIEATEILAPLWPKLEALSESETTKA